MQLGGREWVLTAVWSLFLAAMDRKILRIVQWSEREEVDHEVCSLRQQNLFGTDYASDRWFASAHSTKRQAMKDIESCREYRHARIIPVEILSVPPLGYSPYETTFILV